MAETRADISLVKSDPPSEGGHAGLRPGMLVAIFLGVLAALYWTTVRDLAHLWWTDDNYSHGFLVPVFSGFLVWQRRRELGALAPRGSWVGLPVLLAGVGALLIGDMGTVNFLMNGSLILILAGLVLFHLGPEVFRRVAFPLAFLLFMLPLPGLYELAFYLQGRAAQNAASMLDILGVPVLLDGNVIHLSQITLGVTEACSGIRSLVSLVCLAVAWAYLTLPGVWGMLVLAAAAVPITIVANVGRVVATGLIGQSFGIEYAQGFYHSFSGWIVFVFAFLGLLLVHGLIRLGWAIHRRTNA